jgi:hypothetical protein
MTISGENLKYFVKDLSRNGVFINGKLLGNGNEIEVDNNNEISFIFQLETKIVFKFLSNPNFRVSNLTTPIVSDAPIQQKKLSVTKSNTKRNSEPQGHFSFFNQQITQRREEKSLLEKRANDGLVTIERLGKEITSCNRENKLLQESLFSREEQIAEFKMEIQTLQSNSSASLARIMSLEDQMEDNKLKINDLNSKLTFANLEISRKNALIENREDMLQEVNRKLFEESSQKRQWESQNQQLVAEKAELLLQKQQIANSNASLLSSKSLLEAELSEVKVLLFFFFFKYFKIIFKILKSTKYIYF